MVINNKNIFIPPTQPLEEEYRTSEEKEEYKTRLLPGYMNIDIDLLTACINRERKAQYELYKLTYRYLMSICVRYTSSYEEAQEALNTGFLKILNNMDKYKTNVPFKAWIRRIVINVLIDEYRKEKKHKETIEYNPEYAQSPDLVNLNEAIAKMNVEEIHKHIMKLPPMSQKVFNLYVIDGYEHKEIAEMLGISEGTSKWHVHYSREQLKQLLSHANLL